MGEASGLARLPPFALFRIGHPRQFPAQVPRREVGAGSQAFRRDAFHWSFLRWRMPPALAVGEEMFDIGADGRVDGLQAGLGVCLRCRWLRGRRGQASMDLIRGLGPRRGWGGRRRRLARLDQQRQIAGIGLVGERVGARRGGLTGIEIHGGELQRGLSAGSALRRLIDCW